MIDGVADGMNVEQNARGVAGVAPPWSFKAAAPSPLEAPRG